MLYACSFYDGYYLFAHSQTKTRYVGIYIYILDLVPI